MKRYNTESDIGGPPKKIARTQTDTSIPPVPASNFEATLGALKDAGEALEGGAGLWSRNSCAEVDPDKDALEFMPSEILDVFDENKNYEGARVFGTTPEGNSVFLYVEVKGQVGDASEQRKRFAMNRLVTMAPGKYRLVKEEESFSMCQVELISGPDGFTVGTEDKKPILRILNFDIECPARSSTEYSEHPTHPIIQISNMVINHGDDKPFIRSIFTVGTCKPIAGVDVHSFDTEKELLVAWRQFVLTVDPDILSGFNIFSFDLAYILGRIKKTPGLDDSYLSMGRLHFEGGPVWPWYGRLVLDVYRFMRRHDSQTLRMSGKTLDAIANYLLKEKKEAVGYEDMWKMQQTSSSTRKTIAVYCLKDTYLSMRLLIKQNCVARCIEASRKYNQTFNDAAKPSMQLDKFLEQSKVYVMKTCDVALV